MLAAVHIIEKSSGASTLVVAAISAGAALIGILIGGMVRVFVESRLDRERERRGGRVAARLVYDELTTIAAMLDTTLGMNPPHVPEDTYPLRVQEWIESKPLLAAVVTDDEWRTLSVAYAMVEATSGYLATRSDGYAPTAMDLDGVRKTADHVSAAIDTAEAYASVGAASHDAASSASAPGTFRSWCSQVSGTVARPARRRSGRARRISSAGATLSSSAGLVIGFQPIGPIS